MGLCTYSGVTETIRASQVLSLKLCLTKGKYLPSVRPWVLSNPAPPRNAGVTLRHCVCRAFRPSQCAPRGQPCSAVILNPAVSLSLPEHLDDDIVCIASIMSDKDIFEFVQSLKNIIDAYFDDEIEMNNVAPVPTSSEMRSIMEGMRSFLGAHSNG
ncbi:hypothetical protein TNCV_2876501 [Trichonephila clavipes]|nr:hypothetical protein TNCV_2876501 [Trichonephila clavipes]